ncbi:MAG: hypothetical protein KME42_09485 [Tildeniella nuda ZEHNDER 1965/U140]|jgi:hypothetical protein|nr:hypothetical protein [Tildeniella nuda ZEHNDER 1965/U140]
MLKTFRRLVPLPIIALTLIPCVEGVKAEEELIDGQCQPNPPVNVAANCRSATFIDPAAVEVYNESRRFWLRTDYYGRSSDQNRIVRSMLYETVVCTERKIATTKVVSYTRGGASQSKTQPLEFILPKQQTRTQRSAIRFVCELN